MQFSKSDNQAHSAFELVATAVNVILLVQLLVWKFLSVEHSLFP